MSDIEQPDSENDEVILCVRYTTLASWSMPTVLLLTGATLCYGSYTSFLESEYLGIVLMGLSGVLAIICSMEGLLTKFIIFYRYRLEKVWYFIGKRSIPYERARLVVNFPTVFVWPGFDDVEKGFRIEEIDGTGKALWIQIPIGYCDLCVSSDVRKKVRTITGYLTGTGDSATLYKCSRIFVKSSLPRDILSPD